MSPQQHRGIFQCPEFRMRDCHQTAHAETFNFRGVVHDITQAIQSPGLLKLFFGLLQYRGDDTETEPRIVIYFYPHTV